MGSLPSFNRHMNTGSETCLAARFTVRHRSMLSQAKSLSSERATRSWNIAMQQRRSNAVQPDTRAPCAPSVPQAGA